MAEDVAIYHPLSPGFRIRTMMRQPPNKVLWLAHASKAAIHNALWRGPVSPRITPPRSEP